MKNPFSLQLTTDSDHFCKRDQEMEKLISYAAGNTNVLIYAPRWYGKTALIQQVQQHLSKAGFLTIHIDLFGLSSSSTIAKRFANGLYKAIYERKTVLPKALHLIKSHRPVIRPDDTGMTIGAECASPHLSGSALLDQTLTEFGAFIASRKKQVNLVLDEFQEITEIRNPEIEGILHSHIQRHSASYFFAGSRRRVLLDMFTQSGRPFCQSAVDFELGPVPHERLVDFLIDRFASGGKQCSKYMASRIADIVADHPYYSQKLCFYCYETAADNVTKTDIAQALKELLHGERPVFEAIIQGLAPQQIALLKAIAREPPRAVMAMDYIKRHGLKSIGGIQAALKKLERLDLIHRPQKIAPWTVVNPMFMRWLAE